MLKRKISFLTIALALLLMSAFPATGDEAEPQKFGKLLKPYGLGQTFDLSQYSLKTVDGADAGTLADFDKFIYLDLWATW